MSGSEVVGRIDLYLAATMRPSKDLAARLAEAGSDPRSAREVAERAKQTVFADPLRVRPADLVQFFGRPSQDDPFAVSYDLQLWPRHRYYWHVDDGGLASHGGFVLREATELPSWLPKDLEAARRVFRPWHHTTTDVRRVFGAPDLDLSWFPQQGWYYGPLPAATDLFFDFDLGLLCSISLEPSAVMKYRTEDGRPAPDEIP